MKKGHGSNCQNIGNNRMEIIARIRWLNDMLRRNPGDAKHGRMVMTPGVAALGREAIHSALKGVRKFDSFNDANDPYNEHDYGMFEIAEKPGCTVTLLFKVDYYDRDYRYMSSDPSDANKTNRVITVMLLSEY